MVKIAKFLLLIPILSASIDFNYKEKYRITEHEKLLWFMEHDINLQFLIAAIKPREILENP